MRRLPSVLRALGPAIALVVAASCRDPTAPNVPAVPVLGLRIDISTAAVSLGQHEHVGVTLTNTSPQDVYAAITGTYVVFERRSDTTWVEPRDWFVTDGFGKSWILKPGDKLSATLPLSYLDDQDGEYRFRYLLFADAALTRPLQETDVISPSFVVTR